MSVLPTFVVIGAMKSGTSSLWMYLSDHPSVFLPRKEPNFFSSRWKSGETGAYEELFSEAGAATARGDISPSYTLDGGEAAQRIATVIPQARLIYLIRHPIKRIQAHYLHEVSARRERRPISQAVTPGSRYIEASSYGRWIERYLEHFDREQLLLVTSEDLMGRREETLDRVLTHLGLDTGWRPSDLDAEYHRTEDKRVPMPGVKLLRKVPGARFIAGSRLTRSFSRPIDTAASALSPEQESMILDELKPDIERMTRYMPSNFDSWGLLGVR